MSHRIIEKRRRDRMNNCLADLSRLIPATYLKKFQGRGRIEKTEIIEMAIKHLKHLQAHSCKDSSNCEVAKNIEQERRRQFRLGFQESMSESIRFLVEIEGLYAGNGACIRLVNHLQKHYDRIVEGIPFGRNTTRIENQSDIHSETMATESLEVSMPATERLLIPNLEQGAKKEEYQEMKYEDIPQNSTETSIVSPANDTAMPQMNTGISQLREMLQNPGLPIERIRSNSYSTGSGNSMNTLIPRPSSVTLCTTSCTANTVFSHRVDEVYKFKNNIKDRFNADLQHLPESPLMEDKCNHKCTEHDNEFPSSCTVSESNVSSQTFVVTTVAPSTPLTYRSDLSVKIPDNSHSESGAISNGAWDHIDSSSSSSNPSPPGMGRSNGSSSGYSTGGEMSFNPKYKGQSHQSESASYINSVESLSGHSPSPPTSICNSGIPVFALHPKGTFYIPLTVDAAFVAPYVDTFDDALSSLHPISISVNFCRSLKPEYQMQGNLWQQPNFYVNEKFTNQCGSPERSSVSIPYTTMTRS